MKKSISALALSVALAVGTVTSAQAAKVTNEGRLAKRDFKVGPDSITASVQFRMTANIFNYDRRTIARCRVWVDAVRGYVYTTPEGYDVTVSPTDPDNGNDVYPQHWSRSFKMVREAGERHGWSPAMKFQIKTPPPPWVDDPAQELNPRFTNQAIVYWDLECRVRNG